MYRAFCSSALSISLVFAAASAASAQTRQPSMESAINAKVVALRASLGLPAYGSNPVLTTLATAHAQNMARQEIMNHELDGVDARERAVAAGLGGHHTGENIAHAWGHPDNVKVAWDFWMGSTPHYGAITSRVFREYGVGAYRSSSDKYYFCLVFADTNTPATPRSESATLISFNLRNLERRTVQVDVFSEGRYTSYSIGPYAKREIQAVHRSDLPAQLHWVWTALDGRSAATKSLRLEHGATYKYRSRSGAEGNWSR